SVSYGLRQSQTVTVPISNNGALPQWMRRSLPWSVGESAARGVCDEVVAEEPGPSRVSAFVLPACLACWHAWHFRWRPAREAPVKKTVAPLRHPHGRPSQTIITPGRKRPACAVIMWTDKRTLPQVGQENVNPPLAGRKGVAVLTSGRGSGGGGGGPATAVREGRRHRHRGFLVIRRARAGLSKSGQVSHRACAEIRHSGHDVRVNTRNRVLPHRQPPVTRCARLPFPPGLPFSTAT
ncbi:hypothetical protein TcG_12197, partial [Trypanosoma cruzi]